MLKVMVQSILSPKLDKQMFPEEHARNETDKHTPMTRNLYAPMTPPERIISCCHSLSESIKTDPYACPLCTE